ncbi:hypothetical protein [uncultured Mediterranean phage uvMED]|nr:hypothetical protein [uncultured Mediterranean phage uvMED]BAR19762.1 hypothetical protein [uncultured Mediterranean phage uvMED]BAR19803.1 hypothetical protein [uncultured Mediterranean phage uvMED]
MKKEGRKTVKLKTPLTKDKLENFVLQHIAAWVEEDGKSFIEEPETFRVKMDEFTNSFRKKWFSFEKDNNLRQK